MQSAKIKNYKLQKLRTLHAQKNLIIHCWNNIVFNGP